MTILTADDVKPHLNMGASTINDTDLTAIIPGIEAGVAERVGPLSATATTSVVNGSGTKMLLLPVLPVISITSVTGKSGGVVTVERTDLEAGIVYSETEFCEDYYTVVYSAGRSSVPADLELGIAKLVAADWITTHRGGDSAGFAAALRAQGEALVNRHSLPGFA